MICITDAHTQINHQTIITLGNFDGFHLGHRKLIEEMKCFANETKTVVFSFSPHPLFILQKKQIPKIYSDFEKRFLLEQMNIDYFVEYPFTNSFADKTAESFFEDVLLKQFHCKQLVIGEGYRFGKNGHGTVDFAKQMGAKHGLTCW